MTTTTRSLPWDVMGASLAPADTRSVERTLTAAGLDYTVETRTAHSGDTNVTDQGFAGHRRPLAAPEFQAIVRPMPDGTERVLAFTRKRYTPIQNTEAFAVADTLVRDHGATILGAADFRGGDRSLLALDLAQPVELVTASGDVDRVDLDLVIVNDHAGNAALSLSLTPMRVSCTNALPAALRAAERVWKISHTPNSQRRLDLASEAILKAATYRDAFQTVAQGMLDQKMVDAEFAKMVAKLYPVKRTDEGIKAERRREIQANLLELWQTSETVKSIQGTRWAGYNVVTEYLDHMRPARGDAALSRAEGALDGPYVRQKASLWSMFANA